MADRSETVNFPVTQSILPWTFNFNFGQPPAYGPMTVALGSSANAQLERTLLDAAGSYGRQIGRIGEALGVVLDQLEAMRAADAPPLPPQAADAIADFRAQLSLIAGIKRLNSGD